MIDSESCHNHVRYAYTLNAYEWITSLPQMKYVMCCALSRRIGDSARQVLALFAARSQLSRERLDYMTSFHMTYYRYRDVHSPPTTVMAFECTPYDDSDAHLWFSTSVASKKWKAVVTELCNHVMGASCSSRTRAFRRLASRGGVDDAGCTWTASNDDSTVYIRVHRDPTYTEPYDVRYLQMVSHPLVVERLLTPIIRRLVDFGYRATFTWHLEPKKWSFFEKCTARSAVILYHLYACEPVAVLANVVTSNACFDM